MRHRGDMTLVFYYVKYLRDQCLATLTSIVIKIPWCKAHEAQALVAFISKSLHRR